MLQPYRDGADRISIVSGYATASMLFRHIQALNPDNNVDNSSLLPCPIDIDLVVGMHALSGVPIQVHKAFLSILRSITDGNVNISYVVGDAEVHSKLYVWWRDGVPFKSFLGSANYSQIAFDRQNDNSRMEIMYPADPVSSIIYFDRIKNRSIDINHQELQDRLKLISDSSNFTKTANTLVDVDKFSAEKYSIQNISLLNGRTGKTPARSGINHGQRPNRNPDQAYLPISTELQRSGFFPGLHTVLTFITDDDQVFFMRRGGAGGKNMMTIPSNSDLGRYLRYRIGVSSGAYVNESDLLAYGRTYVSIQRLAHDQYFMNFNSLI